MSRNGIIVVSAAFVVGAAAGWFAVRLVECENVEVCKYGNKETANAGSEQATSAPSAPKVTDAELAALRGKVATLEKELKEAIGDDGKRNMAEAQGLDGEGSKKSSPEVSVEEAVEKCRTYGEVKSRYPNLWKRQRDMFAKHTTRVLERYDNWRGYMSGIDVSSMSEKERQSHVRLMEVYAKVQELLRENMEMMDDDNMLMSREEENSKAIAQLKKEGRKLMAAERDALLRITAENLGRRLGWQEADTAEFAETLRAVGDATSGNMAN